MPIVQPKIYTRVKVVFRGEGGRYVTFVVPSEFVSLSGPITDIEGGEISVNPDDISYVVTHKFNAEVGI